MDMASKLFTFTMTTVSTSGEHATHALYLCRRVVPPMPQTAARLQHVRLPRLRKNIDIFWHKDGVTSSC